MLFTLLSKCLDFLYYLYTWILKLFSVKWRQNMLSLFICIQVYLKSIHYFPFDKKIKFFRHVRPLLSFFLFVTLEHVLKITILISFWALSEKLNLLLSFFELFFTSFIFSYFVCSITITSADIFIKSDMTFISVSLTFLWFYTFIINKFFRDDKSL